jgi:hypothetical protein
MRLALLLDTHSLQAHAVLLLCTQGPARWGAGSGRHLVVELELDVAKHLLVWGTVREISVSVSVFVSLSSPLFLSLELELDVAEHLPPTPPPPPRSIYRRRTESGTVCVHAYKRPGAGPGGVGEGRGAARGLSSQTQFRTYIRTH